MANNKILIVRNAAQTDFGGAERFPVFLALTLQKRGWEPVIISRSKKLLAFARDNSVEVNRGWWWSRQNWSGTKALISPVYIGWQIILYIYYLALFIKSGASVVHLQSKDDFIAGTFAAKTLGMRVIWTDHADLKHIWQNLHIWYKNPIGKLVYFSAHLANAITVVSKSEARLVRGNFKDSSGIGKKITVVYNGVLDQKEVFEKAKDTKTIRFTIASRLVGDKGIREAISAFTELREEVQDVELVILGDGPDRADLKSMSGAENVRFLGHIDEPLKYLAEADVFIHPTYHEGFSVALVEACMMSLPIIATDVGGNTEIIKDHQTGLLVPARDSRALHEAMREMYHNKGLRDECAMNARKQYQQRFRFDKIVTDQFIPLYTKD